jgi:ABC-type sugar transport system substrate-binding protein
MKKSPALAFAALSLACTAAQAQQEPNPPKTMAITTGKDSLFPALQSMLDAARKEPGRINYVRRDAAQWKQVAQKRRISVD